MKAMVYTEFEHDSQDALRMLNSSDSLMQQKLDGARLLAHLGPQDGPIFRQRSGAPMKFAAAAQHLKAIHAQLPEFDTPAIIDGEIIPSTGVYWVFDLIIPGQEGKPYHERLTELSKVLSYHPQRSQGGVRLIPTVTDYDHKVRLYEQAQREGVEGVMLKDSFAPYSPGERVRHSVKLKFVKTAEVVVLEVNRPDARHGSASLGAFNPKGELINVGACSLIGKPQVAPGDVIEVRYLYNSGSLTAPTMYQPRMTQVRTDKLAEDCTINQFGSYSRRVL